MQHIFQIIQLAEDVDHLRDTILDLEVEKFNLMKDLSMMETSLQKYQHDFNASEVSLALYSFHALASF